MLWLGHSKGSSIYLFYLPTYHLTLSVSQNSDFISIDIDTDTDPNTDTQAHRPLFHPQDDWTSLTTSCGTLAGGHPHMSDSILSQELSEQGTEQIPWTILGWNY